MADKEIRLVGSFKDDITPKLAKLSKEIDAVTKSFTKMQGKLRPIARDMGVLAMASERLGDGLRSQRTGFETNIRAMQQYRSEMGKVARAQRAIRPTTLSAPRGGGGGTPRVRGGGGGGTGIGEIAIGSAIGGVVTSAIVAGFQTGVQLMTKPFEMFGRAFAERIGDEMEDIKSAGGMFALDKKSKTPLFTSFEDAMKMQEGLNRSLAKSAAALPGATSDYVKAARGLTDTVMGAFTKNEEAFKKFATELGARQGATSEEAITKVLQRFTEQTVLLGQGQKGGMPLTMLMEQLVTRESVNITGMAARYAQLRSNPLLAGMLKDAEAEINKTTAGTAERFRAVMKALDAALPQEVVNKMRRSVSGLIEATRSAFLDPDTGLFGLSRELQMTVPAVNQFGQYVDENGKAVRDAALAARESTSLFKILKETLANFAVPILELLSTLPQIFDPFKKIAEQFKELRETSNLFYRNFNSYTKWFENQSANFMKQAEKITDPKAAADLKRRANMLKEQAGGRGALATLNNALASIGAIDDKQFKANAAKLADTSKAGIESFGAKGMAEMTKTLLVQFGNSKYIADLAETLGKAMGAFIDTVFTMLDGALSGVESKTGNKIVEAFGRGFASVINKRRADEIAEIIDRLLTKVFDMAANILITKVIPAIGVAIIKSIEAAWKAGPLGKFLVIVGVLTTFQRAVVAATAAMKALALLRALGGGGLRGLGGVAGPARTAAGSRAMAIGAGIRGSFRGSLMGRAGTAMAARGMPAMPGFMGGAMQGVRGAGARMTKFMRSPVGGGIGAGALTAVFSGLETLSQLEGIDAERSQLEKERKEALKQGDYQRVAEIGKEQSALADLKGKTQAEGVGGIAGSLAGGALGGLIGGPIGAMIGAQVGNAIGTKFGPAIGNWWNSTAAPFLSNLGATIGNFFTQTIPAWWSGTAWPGIQNAFNLLKDGIGLVFKVLFWPQTMALNLIRGLAQNIYTAAQNIVPGIGKFFVDLPGKIGSAIKGMFGFGGGFARGGVGGFPKTSGFGMRWGRMHSGNDYGMPTGTKLGLGGPGKVKYAGWGGGYGNMVDIQGADGVLYRFAHLSKINAPVGAVLPPGAVFGLSGNTGNSTGPHLHFEARPGGGAAVNPDRYAGMIRANFGGTDLGGMLAAAQLEAGKMPYGANLAIGNSDEIFMKPIQMSSLVESATRAGVNGAGNFDVQKVEVTVVDNTGNIAQVADQVAEQFLTHMYKASLSVDGRAG
jgi:hypothetical protein